MAAVESEVCEDKSISMRIALFGIRKSYPKVEQLETGDLEKFIKGNEYKNLILLVRMRPFQFSLFSKISTRTPQSPMQKMLWNVNFKTKYGKVFYSTSTQPKSTLLPQVCWHLTTTCYNKLISGCVRMACDSKSVACCQQTCITSLQMTSCNKPDLYRLVETWWNWQACCNLLTSTNKPVKLTTCNKSVASVYVDAWHFAKQLWRCSFRIDCCAHKLTQPESSRKMQNLGNDYCISVGPPLL